MPVAENQFSNPQLRLVMVFNATTDTCSKTCGCFSFKYGRRNYTNTVVLKMLRHIISEMLELVTTMKYTPVTYWLQKRYGYSGICPAQKIGSFQGTSQSYANLWNLTSQSRKLISRIKLSAFFQSSYSEWELLYLLASPAYPVENHKVYSIYYASYWKTVGYCKKSQVNVLSTEK